MIGDIRTWCRSSSPKLQKRRKLIWDTKRQHWSCTRIYLSTPKPHQWPMIQKIWISPFTPGKSLSLQRRNLPTFVRPKSYQLPCHTTKCRRKKTKLMILRVICIHKHTKSTSCRFGDYRYIFPQSYRTKYISSSTTMEWKTLWIKTNMICCSK